MKSRIVSGLLAVVYVGTAYLATDAETAFKVGMFLVIPLACIWFSEEMGSFTGTMHGRAITATSPGCMVAFCGWILLLLPLIMGLIGHFSKSK
ncbi:MAG: hypothetical protein HN350_11540 [Phycisphaerales bacterium]|jgi:hypothetical protein|nr:hypothetical protein [Phycisphaerales bacterium]